MKNYIKLLLLMFALPLLSSCGEEVPTFSLLPDSNVFYQDTTLNNKLDILWVIDNSGSMYDEQVNLANNFNSFIADFASKSYDYQIAVTVTDAWKAPFVSNPNLAKFRDGYGANHSGVFVITPATPNVIQTFITNVLQGTSGSGDERAFQSFKTALDSNLNAGFVREDGYLAIIIVSDEDDFSHNGSFNINQNYGYSGIHSVQSYVDYLDQLTQSTGAFRRYSVSAIAVADQACYQQTQSSGGIIGQRYMELVNATDGVVGDICSPSFATTLEEIQNHISELSTQFYLDREPVPSSIKVYVNGALIPEDPMNGWTYNPTAISIVFHGTAIPAQGSQIIVDFDPVTIL